MPLQRCEASVIRPMCWRAAPPPPEPSIPSCLLCEDMFTTRESTVTGKTTFKDKIPADAFCWFCICSSATFFSPPYPPLPFLFTRNVTAMKLKMLWRALASPISAVTFDRSTDGTEAWARRRSIRPIHLMCTVCVCVCVLRKYQLLLHCCVFIIIPRRTGCVVYFFLYFYF